MSQKKDKSNDISNAGLDKLYQELDNRFIRIYIALKLYLEEPVEMCTIENMDLENPHNIPLLSFFNELSNARGCDSLSGQGPCHQEMYDEMKKAHDYYEPLIFKEFWESLEKNSMNLSFQGATDTDIYEYAQELTDFEMEDEHKPDTPEYDDAGRRNLALFRFEAAHYFMRALIPRPEE